MEKILMSAQEVARVLDVSRTTVYRLVESGHLRSVQIRGSRKILVADLDDYLASLAGSA